MRAHLRGPSLACMFLFGAAVAAHADVPTTTLNEEPAVHRSLHAAAIAGIDAAFALTVSFEAGGALLKCAEGYYFTEPVTTNQTHHIEFRASVPKDCHIAGIYHTHPATTGDLTRFSPADVKVVRTARVPSYIGVAADKSIRVLTPREAEPRTYRERVSQEAFALSGHVIERSGR
jgi:proteasome lid subunit RPN8/RPN11